MKLALKPTKFETGNAEEKPLTLSLGTERKRTTDKTKIALRKHDIETITTTTRLTSVKPRDESV